MLRHLTVVLLTAIALGGGLTATASAESAPHGSISADKCREAGGEVITILMRGACLGGELHGQGVKG